MRYQVIQLIQLLFALALIFGAFMGGIAVGWWRWGRGDDADATGNEGRMAGLRALFSPEDRDDEIVLAEVQLDITDTGGSAGTRGTEGMVFGTGPTVAGHRSLPLLTGTSGPAAAIGPPSDQSEANAEVLDA
jgi:hypothetical protein